MKVKTGPAVGDHQKEWKSTVNSETNNFCSKNKNWDPQYMICLKSELPQTRTVTFKRKKKMKRNPIDWTKPFFENDNNSGKIGKIGKINGYRVPCSEDSGSGQVVLTSINPNSVEDFKYVLAAVYSATTSSGFIDNDGKRYLVPCGSFAYDSKENKFLKAEESAQITSWPDIFNWIKDMAGIEKPSP